MIVATGLTKRFDDANRADGILALDETNFSVAKGEFVAIVGPSGCGKSTLLRLVAGLFTPSSGDLTVGGERPARGRSAVELAYVLQDPTLLPWRRVEDNVALPLEVRGTQQAEKRQRIADALDMVGLTDSAHLVPRQLSGGMRMRASIARALVTHPDLLLMDEPFGALDELSRQRLNEDLSTLWRTNGWTCLFVTHNVQEAVFLSQRVLVMGARPGRFISEQSVTFPFPRERSLRANRGFVEIVAAVSNQLDGDER